MDITVYTKNKHSMSEETYTNIVATTISTYDGVVTFQLIGGECRIAEIILADNVHVRTTDTSDM